ncbi:hypothetical protein BON30_42680 [Cystobacter ferrugineus]|uniref:Uncharacterized protein n=2 Tax=Cystobacter ferrugineus TaxID=83449 RepID=A0A1L9AWY8_9BACT|nr:hypothetical protein BON30_42680 [Cystobacter ferrugineus]
MFDRLRVRPPEVSEAKTRPEKQPGSRPDKKRIPLGQRLREVVDALGRAGTEAERNQLQLQLEKLRTESPVKGPQARGPAGEVTRALEEAALATPKPTMPGRVAIRVTGMDEGNVKIPLGELRVRVSSGDEHVEGLTDSMGHVVLALEATGSFEVEVLSPSGEVIGRTTSRMAPQQPVALEMSVQKKPELKDVFARGRAWHDDLKRRAERIEIPDTRALEQRIASLEATVARLEQALLAQTQASQKRDTDKKGDAQ